MSSRAQQILAFLRSQADDNNTVSVSLAEIGRPFGIVARGYIGSIMRDLVKEGCIVCVQTGSGTLPAIYRLTGKQLPDKPKPTSPLPGRPWSEMTKAEKDDCIAKANAHIQSIGGLDKVNWSHLKRMLDLRCPDGLRRAVDASYRRERNEREKEVRDLNRTEIPHATEARVPLAEIYARLAEIPADTRSTTGVLLGDPLPGRSALDRRRV